MVLMTQTYDCVLSAVANLGISEELKAKLQDVMVARSLLSIGKVLGEGGCTTTVIINVVEHKNAP